MVIDPQRMEVQPVIGFSSSVAPVNNPRRSWAAGEAVEVLFQLHIIQQERHLVGEGQQQSPPPASMV